MLPAAAERGYQRPMLYVVSKVVSALAAPGNVLLLLLGTGVVMLWSRWRRAGRILLSAVFVAAFAVAVLPLSALLIHPLEQRFAPAALPDRVDGIIVLGGAVDPVLSASRGQPALKDAAERLVEGIGLAHRFPAATFVFTGGSGRLFDRGATEADAVRPLLADLGLAANRIVIEDGSRNTFENAVFSRRLVAPDPAQTWLLVTSAVHMPRAVGAFRRAGWDVVPYPVDYRTLRSGPRWWPPSFDLAGGLRDLHLAIHEWLGLLAYRLNDRTPALLPAP